MPSLTLSAIVIRSVNYKDNDRMLTLLSPVAGRVDVLSRGCRRPRSPLLPSSELFATGEFVLFTSKDRHTLTSCTIHDSFYPIRLDYDRLNYGVFMLNLCEAAIHPDEPCEALFSLLIRALHRLTYQPSDLRALAASFMLHYACILGYKPRLMHCVKCGCRIDTTKPSLFDIEEGGLLCNNCQSLYGTQKITPNQLEWLLSVFTNGFDSHASLNAADAPFQLMRDYVLKKIDRPIKTARSLS